jgi:serine/threonine protein kinase
MKKSKKKFKKTLFWKPAFLHFQSFLGVLTQVINGGKHSKASDMYAYGMILWELLTWETPWHDMKAPQVPFCCPQAHTPATLPFERMRMLFLPRTSGLLRGRMCVRM